MKDGKDEAGKAYEGKEETCRGRGECHGVEKSEEWQEKSVSGRRGYVRMKRLERRGNVGKNMRGYEKNNHNNSKRDKGQV